MGGQYPGIHGQALGIHTDEENIKDTKLGGQQRQGMDLGKTGFWSGGEYNQHVVQNSQRIN